MNHFTISDIENLTGIKAHTLRVWEQRYQVCRAKRKESGHRFYDDDDLRNLLRISLLYKGGHKISRLACMQESEMLSLAASVKPKCLHEQFVNQLMEAAQAFDQAHFEKILNLMVLHLGFEKCVVDVIYPFLEKLGMMWLTDKVVPAQEHFASNLIRKKIIVAIDGLEKTPAIKDRTVLIFTPVGEAHEIPLLYMHYLLKKQGSHIVYMGTEVAIETLSHYCTYRKPTHLYFHLITHLCSGELSDYLQCLNESIPGVKIVVSGPAFADKTSGLPGSVKCLRSMAEMISFAKMN